MYRVDGGVPRRVIELGTLTNYYNNARWSPDGTRGAWVDDGGTLRIARARRGADCRASERCGIPLGAGQRALMAWSADGSAVSIVDARDGASRPTAASVPASWSSAGDIASLDETPSGELHGELFLEHEDGTRERSSRHRADTAGGAASGAGVLA